MERSRAWSGPFSTSLALLLVAQGAVGCALLRGGAAVSDNELVEDIHCTYQFQNVGSDEELERIETLIEHASSSDITIGGSDKDTTYTFFVENLEDIDAIHSEILYDDDEGDRLYNVVDPAFRITYQSIEISAALEVTVRFRVTPGAELYYISEDQPEIDITQLVDPRGNVALSTSIEQGQQYIYARTVVGDVEKYIMIDIFSREVQEIDESDYPE
jgi:hypothetical protein